LAVTRNSRHTVIERIRRDRAFAQTLLDEAQTVFVEGEPALARLTLRDLVHGTIGFEGLAAAMQTPSKSLHRMLSARGNPRMDKLSLIFDVLRKEIGYPSASHHVGVVASRSDTLQSSEEQAHHGSDIR
jgi:DNA-binding phage protein